MYINIIITIVLKNLKTPTYRNPQFSGIILQGGPLPVISGVYNPDKWPYKWVYWVITLLTTTEAITPLEQR